MQQAADAIGQMLANGGTRQPGRRREAAAAPLAATGTDDEKPAPADRSIRGASRGSSPALDGRKWQKVAGWGNSDGQDAAQSDPLNVDQKTKKPLRRPLLSAHRRGFRSRGSGRSRTDDGGFAIRCLSHLATEPFSTNINQPITTNQQRHATGDWGVWSSCTCRVDMTGSATKHGCSDPD